MKVFEQIDELRDWIRGVQEKGERIGFVPTMGYLHEGHASLMKQARRENDRVVCSVFVNPTQFGPNEDYDAYPRSREQDLARMEAEGVDAVFFPEPRTMYPEGYQTYVTVEGSITEGLCGASRPGHFKGVTTVVLKLFNLVQPQRAYFGQKDAQQVAVIRRMVADLNVPVEIVACPIVREADGLALSSRNTYLTSEQRKHALVLNRSLKAAEAAVTGGERSGAAVRNMILQMIQETPEAETDYVEVVNADSLMPCEDLKGSVLIALAVRVGKTRLIDNICLEVPCAG